MFTTSQSVSTITSQEENSSSSFRPLQAQPGPQTWALQCSADILIYGGAAGGGKTFALLMEAARHVANPNYGFVIFRRTTPQITNEGGLWDTSFQIFSRLQGEPKSFGHSWEFPSGSGGRFAHLEYEDTIYDWDGSQIPFIGFDQLEHFTEKQFFYLLTRNRTTCGIRPYCRATANPPKERGHWLSNLLSWWIDEKGFPIQERTGVLRYFTRIDGRIQWVGKDFRDSEGNKPKSLTFIPAKLTDNKILMQNSPEYSSTLAAQDKVTRQRLKEGCWNVFEDEGMFERQWIKVIEPNEVPKNLTLVRYWDRASTEPTQRNPDPDWTAGALGGISDEGILYILDMRHFREDSPGNEREIRNTAETDGRNVIVYLEREPGSSGKDVISHYQRSVLKSFTVIDDAPTGDKIVRAKPWCALSENGFVKIVRGQWNHAFLDEVASFPNGKRDQVDAVSGLYKVLAEAGGMVHFV